MVDCLLHNTSTNQVPNVDVFIHKNEHLQLNDQSILEKFLPVTTHATFIMSTIPLVEAINFNDIQLSDTPRIIGPRRRGFLIAQERFCFTVRCPENSGAAIINVFQVEPRRIQRAQKRDFLFLRALRVLRGSIFTFSKQGVGA